MKGNPMLVRGAVVAAVSAVLHALVVMRLLPLTPEAEASLHTAIDLIGTAVVVAATRGTGTATVASAEPLPVSPRKRSRGKGARRAARQG